MLSAGRGGRAGLRVVLGLLVAVLSACGGEVARAPRVLVVGIDGANFRVIGPLFQDERMPNLKRLARTGAWGPLRAFLPLFSPRIWNTMATGKTPERHGIEGFVRELPGGRRLYLSSDRRVPALWNMLSARDIPVAVVNWWNTFPPEKIDGVMVSDHFFPGQLADRKRTVQAAGPGGLAVHPPEWAERGVALLTEDAPLTDLANPFSGDGAFPGGVDRSVLSKIFRFDTTVTRVALAIEEEWEPQVLMVLLTGIDRVSHYLWSVVEPGRLYPAERRPSPEERAAGLAALQAYYAYTDALLGLLLARFGEDDLVLVVSDHGFEAQTFEHIAHLRALRPTGGHDTAAAQDGVIFARGPGVAVGPTAGVTVNDVTPTILAWLGLPTGADMDGSPAGFLTKREVATIPSWDATPVERHAAGGDAEAEIIEQLRELGYLE